MTSDHDYFQMVRRGDPAGAAALFERHAEVILRFTGRMMGTVADAEEVCQDVFLKMIDRADQYDGRAPLLSWLLSIAANGCRDRLRARKLRTSAPLTDADAVAAPGPSPVHALIAGQEARRLAAAMDALTDEQREALVLARFHELAYAEIAALLGTTEGAIKTRIFRALETLRKVMDAGEGGALACEERGADLRKDRTWTTAKL